jgi:hypothetical protein
MQYEKTPLVRPRIRRTFAANHTNDMRKLSSVQVLMRLYKRHETDILTVVVAVEFAMLIVL